MCMHVFCIGCFNNLHLQPTITVMMGTHNPPINIMIAAMIPSLSAATSLPATTIIKTSEFCINLQIVVHLVHTLQWDWAYINNMQ